MGTTGQSITLANSIIGVGILAMPFCFQQCGVLLATLILISMGLVSRLCCYFLLKSAIITRRRNYEFLAFHIFGPAGKMAVEMGIIGFLMGTCIAYFVVVGDLGPQIIAKMLNINQSDILRTSIMVIVSLVCVLPLGLLRNVDSLSNVSAATIAFYFCLVIKVIAEATGQLFTADWTSRLELWKPSGVLQCVPIFSMALFCQTQLFEIFESLPSLSLEKMCVVTKNAINICSGVYFTLGIFGYIAFGSQEISGNILMSLSPTMASDVIKLGFVMSLAFSFPLIIFPCRASLYSFLYRKAHPSHHDHMVNHSIPEGPFRLLTLGIVGVALCVSLLLPTIELVLGLLGATVGVLICVVFPAAAFLDVTFKNTNERLLAKLIVVMGLIILVLGTYANLQAAENSRDKYDDKYITQERIDKIVEDFFQQQEKSEEILAKLENKPFPVKDINELDKSVVKDSEVQPPNPVAPESHSNEKLPVIFPVQEQKIEILPKVNIKDSVLHPKNVISKINGDKIVNGISKTEVEDKIEIPVKLEQPKEEKSQANQQNIDMFKQQQLIETIKQHGQEQKELLKEQKEILDELQKAKKEMQQNKKEIDSSEAKKIAVESIQKIANAAIQSLSGVSDKPADVKAEKQKNNIDSIAKEAVNNINQETKKTLDAIQQIENEKKKNEQLEKDNIVEQAVNNVPELIQKENAPPVIQNLINYNSAQEPIKTKQNVVEAAKQGINKEIIDNNKLDINNLPQKTKEESKNQINPADNKPVEVNVNNKEVPVKEHSHLPDEPKSYREGEDMQMNKNADLKINDGNKQNIPVIKTENEALNKNEPIKSKDNGAIHFKANDILGNIANGNVVPRRKREVEYYPENMVLKPESKESCANAVNLPIIGNPQEVLLPNVNLGDVGLSNSLQGIALHHIRSLKSIQENEKR